MATYATYNAPNGDEQVVTMQGVRFFDGQAKELDETRDVLLIEKLRTNQHFELDEGDLIDSEPPKTGW